MDKKIISLTSKFSKPEKFNSQFHKVKVYVAYAGKNRNGSIISKDTFEKMMPSIYGVPVVGEWKEDKEDFGSHGGKLEISDEGMKYIETTKPYGFVDSSAEVNWEMVTEEDGTEREYLTTEAYLWTSRYPEAIKVLEGENNQSMEINVYDGAISEEDEKYFEITEGEFSALCILGEAVEPCFESAHVSEFNLDKDTFKEEFSLMVKELKESINFNKQEDEITEDDKGGESVEESKFATYNQKREALRNALDSEITRDEDGYIVEEKYYYVADFDDEFVYVERSHWTQDDYNYDYGRFSYSFDEEKIEATINGEFEKMYLTWLTEEEKNKIEEERNQFTQLQTEYEELKSSKEKLESDLTDLKEYKAKIEKDQLIAAQEEIFEEYDVVLKDNVQYQAVKDNRFDYTVEELEKELAVIYVRSNNKFSKKDKKTNIKIGIEPEETNKAMSPYGDIF